MAIVTSPRKRALNRLAVAAVIVITLAFLSPLYWIGSTAFKPRNLATTVPPTVLFQPEITAFIKLFTKRVQLTKPVDRATYDAALWYEQRIYDGGERILRVGPNIQLSQYPNRFMNSLIISIISTAIAVSMGTITAYGFSRFKMAGEADLLFFILSTRMLPPIVVAIPMYLMYRAVGLNDSHLGLIILYTAFNLSLAVWLMKGFIDEIPRAYEESALVDGYSRLRTFLYVIVPQASGDACDTFARLLGHQMGERLGQTLVTDNRPGAGGTIGLSMTASAPADGYTFACGQGGNMSVIPHTMKNVPYDALKDFAPIALIATNYLALVVYPGAPFKTTAEFVKHLKANPGKVSFGSNGEGAFLHMAAELFRSAIGFDYVHVPFKGGVPMAQDVMAGRVDAAFSSFTGVPSPSQYGSGHRSPRPCRTRSTAAATADCPAGSAG